MTGAAPRRSEYASYKGKRSADDPLDSNSPHILILRRVLPWGGRSRFYRARAFAAYCIAASAHPMACARLVPFQSPPLVAAAFSGTFFRTNLWQFSGRQ